VDAGVTPNPAFAGHQATLAVGSQPGARCTASVAYSTGKKASIGAPTQVVGANRGLFWRWVVDERGVNGKAIVTCTGFSQTRTATAAFRVR